MATLNSSSVNGSLSITGDISNKKYVRAQPSDENTAGDSYQNDFLLGNSFIGSMCHATDGWQNIINVRHRNGDDDGTSYGLQIVSGLTTRTDRLYFRHQSSGTWGDWYSIANLGDIPSAGALSSVGRYPGSGGAGTTSGVYLTPSVLYYWNGAVTGTSSNLQYCDRGRFGTIVTASSTDYALAAHTHDYLPTTGGELSGTLTISDSNAIAFTGPGSGTYNRGFLYVSSDGITFETPRASDNANAASKPFYVKTRGGQYTSLYAGNIYDNGTRVSVEGHTHDYLELSAADTVRYYNSTTGSSGFTNNYFGVGLDISDRHGGSAKIRIDWGDDYSRGIFYRSHSDRGNDHNWKRILDSDCVTYSSGTLTLSIK